MRISKKSLKSVGITLFVLILSIQVIVAVYIPTAHDTKLPPETISYVITDPTDYELLTETENFKYYFKDSRDVLSIVDKRNGYTWKTGLDVEFNTVLEDACDLVPEADQINCEPIEDRMNTTYIGIANSLITIEYYDSTNAIKRKSSASKDGVDSTLVKVDGKDNVFRLDVNFKDLDIEIKVHITLDDKGFTLDINDEDITGDGQSILAAIMLTPFLGASGGQKLYWDPARNNFKREVPSEMIDGYVFVPDGPGALIRFVDRNIGLSPYVSKIYGENPAEAEYYYTVAGNHLPLKQAVMPVYGIAHGNRQAAFVAFATQGAGNMKILVSPEEDITYYTYAYTRFEYNRIFFQVYNKRGDGFFTSMEERRHFDVSMTYQFLANDTDRPADYVGMALTYRDYLLDNDGLPQKISSSSDVGIRLDFVMADIKKSVLGLEDVIVTTAKDVENILTQLDMDGIKNINSGLLGWQAGGITNGHPGTTNFSSAIGSSAAFKSLLELASSYDYDVSFSQNYAAINKKQVNYQTSAARHMNSWYIETRVSNDYPISVLGIAKPSKSAAWLKTQSDKLIKLGVSSLTIDGISNILTSDYDAGTTSIVETIELYTSALGKIDPTVMIAMQAPNDYLWKYVDRYLNTPVFSNQFLIETDTVPFLQMVLNNRMEMYAPYSNFSFYTQKDILRMIDYNLYPSFALSQEPAYKLALTNSNRYYSTEFKEYEPLIKSIYSEVNLVLREVSGKDWIDRTVVENGVILNTYSDGTKVLINYTEDALTYGDQLVRALSAVVVKE